MACQPDLLNLPDDIPELVGSPELPELLDRPRSKRGRLKKRSRVTREILHLENDPAPKQEIVRGTGKILLLENGPVPNHETAKGNGEVLLLENGPELKRKTVKTVAKRRSPEDQLWGQICHHCRQKRFVDHVMCSNSNCTHKFCGQCLLNRHGENIESEMAKNAQWICPRCRGGCGPGCYKSCCNCGPCRKKKKLQPTGQLLRSARYAGFGDVHDYLVHLETGESPAAIANRKRGRRWTSIDGPVRTTGIMAIVMIQQRNVGWGNRKCRSKATLRWQMANLKWGSGDDDEELFDKRIMLNSLGSKWELGRKIKSKKEPVFHAETQSSGSTWELGRKPKSKKQPAIYTETQSSASTWESGQSSESSESVRSQISDPMIGDSDMFCWRA